MKNWKMAAAMIGLMAALRPGLAHAVILYGTDNPGVNTSAPGGGLLDSGWQYQGTWGSFLGTPIGAQYFITAAHVGAPADHLFQWNGNSYLATSSYTHNDLCIWKIDGTFSSYASLYLGSDEVGKDLVVFGRGTQRGSEVSVDGTLKGWAWGRSDGVMRWGQNQVSATINVPGLGVFLQASFDAAGGMNEAHLSGGDSGGAVFINDGGTWKLAGINYAVDGPFRYSVDGADFNAALFNERGLYTLDGNPPAWQLVTDDTSTSFYASRISDSIDWINTVTVPEPWQWSLLTVCLLLGLSVKWRCPAK